MIKGNFSGHTKGKRITSATLLRRYYTKADVKKIINHIEFTNEDGLKDLSQKYCEINNTLNTFIKLMCNIDDEMRFIRNLINFGGNKAQELDKKKKEGKK